MSGEKMVSLSDFTLEDGKYLVGLARRTVETYLKTGVKIVPPQNLDSKYYEKLGVFVTIERIGYTGTRVFKELRGCIGYPYPIKPLVEALIDSAVSAAVEDPRFPPMKFKELDNVVFEVSVLSKPEELKVKNRAELPKLIVIGKDGLIVEYGWFKGLLLPQVPVEYKWDVETFLAETCMKAGLPPDSWLLSDVKVYRFEAAIFCEKTPKGEIVKRDLFEELKKCHG